MRTRNFLIYLAGVLTGGVLTFAGLRTSAAKPLEAVEPSVCYSCFWQGYDAKLHSDLIDFYRQYKNPDPLVFADTRYILWRATGVPNCDIRQEYRRVARSDADPQRRYVAYAVLAFGAPECAASARSDYAKAAEAAAQAGLSSESTMLRKIADGTFAPQVSRDNLQVPLTVPAGTKSFILGRSKIEIAGDTRIGAQVDRVSRDWISYQLKWDLRNGAAPNVPIDYHEGALLNRIRAIVNAPVIPLVGSIAVRQDNHWYAADESGVFRFEVLPDKVLYPTTHVDGDRAWMEDTHGISALVPSAIEHGAHVVIGCGDSHGKMQAALHLAQRGIHVIFPGDRYQDELLGYSAPGTLMGGAPVRGENGKVIVGDQPVRISVSEPIVAQDTIAPFPLQYYDAPARYFRKLARSLPLRVTYAQVDAADEMGRVLETAAQQKANVVGVRVVTDLEYVQLRLWLSASRAHRAVLFHSGLYPQAEKLFSEFRSQVTFGDLHPEFEAKPLTRDHLVAFCLSDSLSPCAAPKSP